MRVSKREIALAQVKAPSDGHGQILGPAAVAGLQRRLHRGAHGLGRNAGNGAIDGNQPALLLDGGADQLQNALFPFGLAVQKQLAPHGQLLLQPRLIVPDHRRDLVAISDKYLGDEQLPGALLPGLTRTAAGTPA